MINDIASPPIKYEEGQSVFNLMLTKYSPLEPKTRGILTPYLSYTPATQLSMFSPIWLKLGIIHKKCRGGEQAPLPPFPDAYDKWPKTLKRLKRLIQS